MFYNKTINRIKKIQNYHLSKINELTTQVKELCKENDKLAKTIIKITNDTNKCLGQIGTAIKIICKETKVDLNKKHKINK